MKRLCWVWLGLLLMSTAQGREDLTHTRETDFFRNRVFLTALKDINTHLTLGLGYVRQSDKIGGDWRSFNAIQTLVTWHF